MNTTTFLNEINNTFEQFFETLKYNDLHNDKISIQFELEEYCEEIKKEIERNIINLDKSDFVKYFKYKIISYIFNQSEIISNYYIETGKYRKINEIINEYLKTTIEEDEAEEEKQKEKDYLMTLKKIKNENDIKVIKLDGEFFDLRTLIINTLKDCNNNLDYNEIIDIKSSINRLEGIKREREEIVEETKIIIDKISLFK
jgi:septum formation inhibitor MinC